LLAAGHPGIGVVSDILDTCPTLPATWNSGGWRFWFTKKHYYATGEVVAAVVSANNRIIAC